MYTVIQSPTHLLDANILSIVLFDEHPTHQNAIIGYSHTSIITLLPVGKDKIEGLIWPPRVNY
jgi:hypothetical protein